MKTAAKVSLIVSAVFILLGICLILAGYAANAKPDVVLNHMGGNLNMNFRIGSDGIHYGHGPSYNNGGILDDIPGDADPDDILDAIIPDDDFDDAHDDSEFMDELEDAFEDAGISERKLHEIMDKYNISEADIKNKLDEYNISVRDLRRALKMFGVNESNIDEFIGNFINGNN